MAAISFSTESSSRRTFRMSLGVCVAFFSAWTIRWELAFICPILTAMMLQETTGRTLLQSFVSLFKAVIVQFFVLTLSILTFDIYYSWVFIYLATFYIVFSRLYREALDIYTFVSIVVALCVIPLFDVELEQEILFSVGVIWSYFFAFTISYLTFLIVPYGPRSRTNDMKIAEPKVEKKLNKKSMFSSITLCAVFFTLYFSGSGYFLVPAYVSFLIVELKSNKVKFEGVSIFLSNALGLTLCFFYFLILDVGTIQADITPWLLLVGLSTYASLIFYSKKHSTFWVTGLNGLIVMCFSFSDFTKLPQESLITSLQIFTSDRLTQLMTAGLIAWLVLFLIERLSYSALDETSDYNRENISC